MFLLKIKIKSVHNKIKIYLLTQSNLGFGLASWSPSPIKDKKNVYILISSNQSDVICNDALNY